MATDKQTPTQGCPVVELVDTSGRFDLLKRVADGKFCVGLSCRVEDDPDVTVMNTAWKHVGYAVVLEDNIDPFGFVQVCERIDAEYFNSTNETGVGF